MDIIGKVRSPEFKRELIKDAFHAPHTFFWLFIFYSWISSRIDFTAGTILGTALIWLCLWVMCQISYENYVGYLAGKLNIRSAVFYSVLVGVVCIFLSFIIATVFF